MERLVATMSSNNLEIFANIASQKINDNKNLFLCHHRGCKFSTLYSKEYENHIEDDHDIIYICKCDFVTNKKHLYMSHLKKCN